MALLTLEELAQQILALPAEQRALPVLWYHPPTGGLGPVAGLYTYSSKFLAVDGDKLVSAHPDLPVIEMGSLSNG